MSVTQAQELLASGGNVHVLDTRTPEEFAADHVATAANVRECFTYLIPSTTEDGIADLVATFTRVFSDAGLSNSDDEIVLVYEDGMSTGFAQSCRTWFLLTLLGHKNVKVIDGGYQAWKLANFPITPEVTPVPKTTFKTDVQRHLIATVDDVKAVRRVLFVCVLALHP